MVLVVLAVSWIAVLALCGRACPEPLRKFALHSSGTEWGPNCVSTWGIMIAREEEEEEGLFKADSVNGEGRARAGEGERERERDGSARDSLSEMFH